jgi:hypothetical protein
VATPSLSSTVTNLERLYSIIAIPPINFWVFCQ